MKKYVFIFALIGVLAACGSEGETNETSDSTETAKVDETPMIKIGEFDAVAGEYIDKTVKVKGIVDHVCRHGGKRLFLVDDEGDLHVESEERFNDSLMGNEVTVTGIVREFRVDEAYCMQEEEDNIKSHSEGQTNTEQFEQKKQHIAEYRDSMKVAGVDHLSFYSLEFVELN
jgi:DNA/RNA endonuclease YhcR with UshA esterase domain